MTINGVTYSLANPYDFAFPASASGNNGGLGLSALAGWYGTSGPHSQRGHAFWGHGRRPNHRRTNQLRPAQQLQSRPGLAGHQHHRLHRLRRQIHQRHRRRRSDYINLQFTGEVWRQSNLPKTLEFYYFIDPGATGAFSTSATAFLPALNVSFPTVAADVGGVAVDGTAPLNQAFLGVTNQVIAPWEPGAALWLVWEMASSAGKSQGLAIDNLSFSASVWPSGVSAQSLGVQARGTNLLLSCPGTAGLSYQFEYATNLNTPSWIPLGTPIPGTGSPIVVSNSLGIPSQCFYRLSVLP